MALFAQNMTEIGIQLAAHDLPLPPSCRRNSPLVFDYRRCFWNWCSGSSSVRKCWGLATAEGLLGGKLRLSRLFFIAAMELDLDRNPRAAAIKYQRPLSCHIG